MSNDQLTGRDLDAAIAVKLFEGFELTHYGEPPQVRPDIPRYSESWDAMRLVVEAMRARGYPRFQMEHREYKGKWEWVASFWPGEGESGYFKDCVFSLGAHTDKSLPVAVCRAALKALGKHQSPLRDERM